MYLRPGIVICSFILSFLLSHGVLFFISVLRHYPRFVHSCYPRSDPSSMGESFFFAL
jgi:hypothetical protein